jgi:hypothetical protein
VLETETFTLDALSSKADRSKNLGICLWSLDSSAAQMTTSVNSVNAQRRPLRGGSREIMLDSSDDLMSVVVLEAGAAWPPWLTEYQRLAPNAVVIAQARSDAPDAFRSRVVHRIAEATAGTGARVRVGVIVAGDSQDDERLAQREQVARAILKAMGTGREAELVLAGDAQELEGPRHELFGLAGALCQQLGGTNVSVKVRFSSGPHSKSGVMRSVTPSTPDTEVFTVKGGG